MSERKQRLYIGQNRSKTESLVISSIFLMEFLNREFIMDQGIGFIIQKKVIRSFYY